MRGKGEGSISRRADGRWHARLTLEPGPDGRRKRKDLYGRTRKDVLAKLDRARENLRGGIQPISAHDQRITVAELVDEWLAALARPSSRVGALTQAQYRLEANTRVLPQLGGLPATQLDDGRLTEWQNVLLDAGYAPRSVLKARIVIGAVIMLARRKRILHANPLELVPGPQPRKPKKRAITGQEAGRFIQAVRGHRWETLILADLLTGMRRGELLGWMWSDIDLDAGTIHIRHQLQRIPNVPGLKLLKTKSDAGERLVPLPSLLVERLREQKALRRPGVDLVFTSALGTAIEPRNFNRVFKKLVDAAGLAPLTPHELRHSMSTILLHLGVTPLVVSQLLGHADPSVTLRWYSHAVPDDHREAMARMDDYVRRLADEHGGSGVNRGVNVEHLSQELISNEGVMSERSQS